MESNQICWHQEPACWHVNQRKLHTWWVEASSLFVEYHKFLDVLLQACLSFKQKAECRVKEEVKKVLPEKVRRWQSRSPRIWRRWKRDLLIGCRTTCWGRGRILRKIWAIPTTSGMPKRNKVGFQLASGNGCGTRARIQPSILKWGNIPPDTYAVSFLVCEGLISECSYSFWRWKELFFKQLNGTVFPRCVRSIQRQ